MTRQFDDEENTKLRQFVTCAVINLMRYEKKILKVRDHCPYTV